VGYTRAVVETVMAFRVGISDFLPTYFTEALGMSSVSSGLLFTGFLVAGLPAPYFWGSSRTVWSGGWW
jgi:sugar phosphate permease